MLTQQQVVILNNATNFLAFINSLNHEIDESVTLAEKLQLISIYQGNDAPTLLDILFDDLVKCINPSKFAQFKQIVKQIG
jgi:hypothetical protein